MSGKRLTVIEYARAPNDRGDNTSDYSAAADLATNWWRDGGGVAKELSC